MFPYAHLLAMMLQQSLPGFFSLHCDFEKLPQVRKFLGLTVVLTGVLPVYGTSYNLISANVDRKAQILQMVIFTFKWLVL